MRRSVVAPLAIALLAALLALAGTSGASVRPSPASASVRPSPASASARPGFPVTVHSANGLVTIPRRPTRILSLSPSATQMVYAIGAGRQVVGVDKYSAWPKNAPRTRFTGGETSAEDYLPLRPDLVLLAYSTGTIIAQLEKLHIPTLLLPPATDLAGVQAQLGELGAATGHRRAAAASWGSFEHQLGAEVAAAGAHVRGQSYYIEFDPTLYTATSKTVIGAVLARFGLRDIADAAGKASAYPQLSAEYLVSANPEWVFLADTDCCGQNPARFASRPGFSHLAAVELHHVIDVPDSLASQWGPHTLEAFVALAGRALAAGAR